MSAPTDDTLDQSWSYQAAESSSRLGALPGPDNVRETLSTVGDAARRAHTDHGDSLSRLYLGDEARTALAAHAPLTVNVDAPDYARVKAALDETQGNVTRAAPGWHRNQPRRWLDKHHVEP